jgi:hypothetical protein
MMTSTTTTVPATTTTVPTTTTTMLMATSNGLVDASADLPGPGAIALPGPFLAHN